MAEDTEQDQKTEDASGKRLDEAREKGQIAVSREMSTFLVLLATFIVIADFAQPMCVRVINTLRVFIEKPDQIPLEGIGIQTAMLGILTNIGLATALIFSFLFAASVLATMFQTGFFFSFDMIKMDFERLDPMNGIHRLFSMNSVMELAKSFVKIVVLGSISFTMIMPVLDKLPLYTGHELLSALALTHREVVHILSVLLVVIAIVAVADWVYQRYTFYKSLRMTKQEVKDEYKQTEGDPIIKSRLRQIRMEKARKRMIANVPKADVVITNPTHYAVALQYDNQKMKAPIVLAKGIDQVAMRIRAVAEENNVPLVSNPPLARTLYDTVELDHPIKTEQYRAVAEVISYVFKLKKKRM